MTSHSGPVRVYVQEIRPPRPGERFATNERVLDAIEALANGNRPLTSKAMLQCRIAEIAMKRRTENEQFRFWAERMFPLP